MVDFRNGSRISAREEGQENRRKIRKQCDSEFMHGYTQVYQRRV